MTFPKIKNLVLMKVAGFKESFVKIVIFENKKELKYVCPSKSLYLLFQKSLVLVHEGVTEERILIGFS